MARVIVLLAVLAFLSPATGADAAGYWQLQSTRVMKPAGDGKGGFSFGNKGLQGGIMKLHIDKDTFFEIDCYFHEPPKQLIPGTITQLVLRYQNLKISNPKKMAVSFGMGCTWDVPGLGPGLITGGATRVAAGQSNMVQGAAIMLPSIFKTPAGSGKRSVYKSCGYGNADTTYTVEYQYVWVNR
jgi:hypothetical protein